ncbi:MAG TPA: hypothetical protein VFJ11_07995 [Gaiellaceae bacterium]|nr:hypothetical protein [Gaiellaceae bacterium]
MLLQLRAALPRILALLAVVLGGTAAVAGGVGALAGRSIAHSLATGYYVVGAAILVGSFVMGSRGPWRSDADPVHDARLAAYRTRPRRRRRKATLEERVESKRTSFGLFVLGIALVLLGALLDPSRRAF